MLLKREVSAARQETAARLFESCAESRVHKPEVSAHPHERALAAADPVEPLRGMRDVGASRYPKAAAEPATCTRASRGGDAQFSSGASESW